MSRFRTFLDKTWNRIRDFAQGRDFYRSRIDHYHIGGDEIGISKEYGLLDYKSNLNDPEYWNTVLVDTKPESGGEQVYGTETFSNWSRRAQRAKDAARETNDRWDFWNTLGLNLTLPDYVKRAILREYESGSLHGVSTRQMDPLAGIYRDPDTGKTEYSSGGRDARVARRAVDSRTRIKDIEDLEGTVEVAGERFDVRQEIEGSKFEFKPEKKPRQAYSTKLGYARVERTESVDGGINSREVREVDFNVFGNPIGVDPNLKYNQKYRAVEEGNLQRSFGPTDPLAVPGISNPTHEPTELRAEYRQVQSVAGLRYSEGSEEKYNYVKRSSIIPSWFRESSNKENVGRNKSKVATQRDISQVQVMSDWEDGKPKDAYLTNDHPIYSFRDNFKRLQYPILTQSKVGSDEGSMRNRISGSLKSSLSINSTLPREVEGSTADVLYKIRLGKGKNTAYGYPGGHVVDSLEYNTEYEEKLGLIPFCITTITPDHRVYLNFPAYLENYDDSYTGDWDSAQYVGRAEKFWGYTGFSREISLSFKVLGRNPVELIELYHRLNRLVGGTTPSYDKTGLFMRGTLASITIGDLLKHKTGIIKNVKLSWEQDIPWETDYVQGSGLPATKDGNNSFRVPYSLNVNLGFTPIEEATVTEDFGAYFAFDYKKVPEPVSQVQENKDKESQLGIARPKAPSDDWIWDYSLNGGAGGWRLRKNGEVDMSGVTIGRPGQFDSPIYNGQSSIPFNPVMY